MMTKKRKEQNPGLETPAQYEGETNPQAKKQKAKDKGKGTGIPGRETL